MSTEANKPTPSFDPQLLKQLLAERKTAGEIEDLLKDLRKAFIEEALQGELTHLLGYEKHSPAGRRSGNSRGRLLPQDDQDRRVGSRAADPAGPQWRVRAATDRQTSAPLGWVR